MRPIISVDIWDVRDPYIEYIRNSLRPCFTHGLVISTRALIPIDVGLRRIREQQCHPLLTSFTVPCLSLVS
jgi:hypothetical protein